MAKATARYVEKTRIVEEPYKEFAGVTLELSEDEAAFLTALLGGFVVGGGPSREISNRIWDVLNDAGMHRDQNSKTYAAKFKLSGGVTCIG